MWLLFSECLLCLTLSHAERGDYSTRACNSTAQLRQNDTAQVALDFLQDSVAMEGTEVLLMELQLSEEQQSIFTSAGNVFIQNVSIIQIHDSNSTSLECMQNVLFSAVILLVYGFVILSDVILGFSEDDYSGSEGPDRRLSLPNAPCRVGVSLQDITIEAPLTFRLIPQTIPENVNANGPLPTATLIRANASSKDL